MSGRALAVTAALALATVTIPATATPTASTPDEGDPPPDGLASSTGSILDLARNALDHKAQRLDHSPLDPASAADLTLARANLDTAERLLTIHDEERGTELDRAVRLAAVANQHQAHILDAEDPTPVPTPEHDAPNQALLALADRHDTTPTEQTRDQLDALDDLPPPTAHALTTWIDAFLALDTATQAAYQDADPQELAELAQNALTEKQIETTPTTSPAHPALNPLTEEEDHAALLRARTTAGAPELGQQLASVGVDLTPIFPARAQFLQATHELHDALASNPGALASTCAPIQLAPAFSLTLDTCDTTYTQDYALALDAGGNDTYHNNAGGSNLAEGNCNIFAGDPGVFASAALLDLGEGADAYGDPAEQRVCGVNGGGYFGIGLLLDEAGDDAYVATTSGANGGALGGIGLLLDLTGDDAYQSTSFGTNGGGRLGVGLLADLDGDDRYNATEYGANGGADLGVGHLLDFGGEDTYTAQGNATNGGSLGPGLALLIDTEGHDTYTAESLGTNGGTIAGQALLIDRSGDDTYVAGEYATNGGAAAGIGGLLDGGGNDTLIAGDIGTNGGAWGGSVGLVVNDGGNDTYRAGSYGTNGGGYGISGIAHERVFYSAGALIDTAGDDSYHAGDHGVNGGGDLSAGLLHDGGGTDLYEDALVDCQDCSRVPKGTLGAQVDSDDSPP